LNKSIFSTVFNSTTTCYKYYWWLAILHLIKENGSDKLTFDDISFKMLSLVWYPINYYKVSLGKQDQLTKYVIKIKNEFLLNDDISETDFILILKKNRDDVLIRDILKKMMRFVPYRFIRPWVEETVALPDGYVNDIIFKKHKHKNAIYNINKQVNGIYFTNNWYEFIINNFKMIEDFTLYNLYKFVEKHNPEVSNISIRLWKPKARKLSRPTKLWKFYVKQHGNFKTIFSNHIINELSSFSIDHYLPWSYITHDKLWNLHPENTGVNSSKSNHLPSNTYLINFCKLQYNFVQFLGNNFNEDLVDYNLLFNTNSKEILEMPEDIFTDEMQGKFKSHIQIASNMGFAKDWELNPFY
jgi:hypothetical protein